MFIAAQFTRAKWWKQPKCPSVNERIKNCGTFTQWSNNTQENFYPLQCTDGTGEYYAKWNKPGSEKQIPYDLTYKRFLFSNSGISVQDFQVPFANLLE